jgi:hypothetical protein
MGNIFNGSVISNDTVTLCAFKWIMCSKTRLTGESRFHISTPLGIEPGSLMTGRKRVVHWTSETWYECSEIAGSPQGSPPPSSQLCRLWSWKEDLQRVWNWARKAVWDQAGLSHCRYNGLVTVRDEARLRRGQVRLQVCMDWCLLGLVLLHKKYATCAPKDDKSSTQPLWCRASVHFLSLFSNPSRIK